MPKPDFVRATDLSPVSVAGVVGVSATAGGSAGNAATLGGHPWSDIGNAAFVMVVDDPNYPNARLVTEGIGLSITDAGAGGALTFALDFSGTPTTITPDASSAAGTGTRAARIDHVHGAPCAAAGIIIPDTSASEGTSSSLARADHQHAIETAAPSTDLSVSTTNQEGTGNSFARAAHVHAITTSSNPGANAAIMATNAQGGFAFDTDTLFIDAAGDEVGINAGTNLSGYNGALAINTGANDRKGQVIRRYSSSQTAHLWEAQDQSGNALILVNKDGDIMSSNFVSGIDGHGWALTHDGRLEANSAFIRGALYASTFAYKDVSALNGYLMVTNAAPLKKALTADAGDTTLIVEDPVFAAGSWLRLQTIVSIANPLVIQVEWMYVTASNGWNSTYGGYSYTVTRNVSSYAGGALCAWDVATAVTEWGRGSTGGWVLMVGGSTDAEGPYVRVTSRTGSNVSDWLTQTQFGNLEGVLGDNNERYGIAIGDLSAGSKKYFTSYRRVSDGQTQFTLHGVEMNIYDSAGNQRGKIDPNTLGSEQTLFWLGASSSNKQLDFRADGTFYLDGDVLVEKSVVASKLLSHGVNMLDDPSFEEWATGWTTYIGYVSTGATNSHTGQRRYSAEGNGTNRTVAIQTIPIEEGAKYYASVWIRYILAMTGNAGLFVNWLDHNYSTVGTTDAWMTVPSSYQQTYVVATAPANAAYARFSLTVRSDVGAGEWVEFDDAEFYRADGHLLIGSPGGARIEAHNSVGVVGYSDASTEQFRLRITDGRGEFAGGYCTLGAEGIGFAGTLDYATDSEAGLIWYNDDTPPDGDVLHSLLGGKGAGLGDALGAVQLLVNRGYDCTVGMFDVSVYGKRSGVNNLGGLNIHTGISASVGGDPGWRLYGQYSYINGVEGTSDSTKYIAFGVDTDGVPVTERMRITSAGKVGIGTNAPETILEVGDGASSTQSWMQILASNSAGNAASLVAMSGSKALYLYCGSILKLDAYDYGTSAALDVQLVGNGGGVGVGTYTIDANYILQLPNSSTKKAKAYAWDTYACSEQTKDRIERIPSALSKISSLRGITFNWKEGELAGKRGIGVTAEELDALGLPGLVEKDGEKYTGINLTNLVPVLIEAVKELQAEVMQLKQKAV